MRSCYLTAVTLGCLFIGVAVRAQTIDPKTDAVLKQALDYQRQFRDGKMDVVPQYVALLEEATTAVPDNADLWFTMGDAYLAQAARALLPGGNPPDAMTPMRKGPAALQHALQLNPNHARALATLGGVEAMMGSLFKAPRMAAKGVADMNRAVEIAPDNTRIRLQRAFSGLSLPDELRNNAAEAEDLDFVIEAADWGQPADYLRIMRGDLYFELGKTDQARAMYQTVETSDSPAAAAARTRLAAMEQGGVAVSDIKTLRAAAGAQCSMCHGH